MQTLATSGQTLTARLLRGAGVSALGFAGAQILRFGSNLVLARLLFPEAFGLMALVTVLLVGVVMMSDAGIGQSVRQSPRGDDPVFLDTAFTMQVLRGMFLWSVIALLALPAAQFYRAPELALMLPVAGSTLLLASLEPMRAELAYRHLAIARVTVIDLVAQAAGVLAMISLAWVTGSVWSLVVGMIVASAMRTALLWLLMPGRSERLRWEGPAARELFRFGIWIFLSSAFGFLLSQGDKAIFGRFLAPSDLGIYNIAFFLASAPMLLASAMTGSLLLPAYRIAAEEGPSGVARLHRLRFRLTGVVMAALALLALIGPWLIDLLYDHRYAAAGPILVWIALMQMWPLIGLTYDQAALAAGDSRSFFWVMALRALVQTAFFLVGLILGGLQGALAGQALAALAVHPAIIWLARRHGVWDPRHDLSAAAVAAAFALAYALMLG